MGAQPNILRASNGETRPNALDDVNGLSRQVIEALPAALYMTDAEGRITFYKEAAAALWGWHPEVRIASSPVPTSYMRGARLGIQTRRVPSSPIQHCCLMRPED